MSSQLPAEESEKMPSLFSAANVGALTQRSQSMPYPSANIPPARRQSTIESFARNLRTGKTEIDVVLDDGNGLVHSYSTYDQIKGHVEIKFEKDTLINDLAIFFEGVSNTYVEKIATASPTTGRTTGRHTFLRMQQPILEDALPDDKLAKANVTYTFPFTFVVPDKLLPYVCGHKVEYEEVRDAHLNLPPSMGDPMLAGDGHFLLDDLAPEMSKITYAVKARVRRAQPSTGRIQDIVEKCTRVRVIPARDEEPPLAMSEESKTYKLRKEKNVRKGLFKIGKKMGRITAEALQPKSFRLPHPQKRSTEPISTMATVNLRFDPASVDEQPPQLGNLNTKLKVFTFFGAACYQSLPEIGRWDHWSSLHGHFPEAIDLASRNIGSVSWTKRYASSSRRNSLARQPSAATTSTGPSYLTRRSSDDSSRSDASGSSNNSIPDPSVAYDPSLPFYTAQILVPLTLPGSSSNPEPSRQSVSGTSSKAVKALSRNPRRVVFLPSFHACIISRTYTLELGMTFHPVNASGNTTNKIGAPSLNLRIPVQISQEGSERSDLTDDPSALMYALELDEANATSFGDEAVARQLDRELNFRNPFNDSAAIPQSEVIPEYEAIQTTLPGGLLARHGSLAYVPRNNDAEQPPEYYSPFRSPGNNAMNGGRRHDSDVVTRIPMRNHYIPIAFLGAV